MQSKLGWTLAISLGLAVLGGCSGSESPEQAPASPTGATSEAVDAVDAEFPDREGWPEEFRIGFFGGEDAEQVLETSAKIQEYLEARLDIDVSASTGTSYAAVIEAMRANRVDAMEVGPFSYILAVQQADAEAIVIGALSQQDPGVYDPEVQPHYFSVIVTKKGNGIERLDDLRGQDLSFVDPASTSGHLMPRTILIKAGIDAENDLQTMFAGSHPTAVLPVASGAATACGTNEINLTRMQENGIVEYCGFPDGKVGVQRTEEEIRAAFEACPDGNLAILAMSDPIPSTPLAVRKDLPESFKNALRKVLLEVKDRPEIVAVTRRWYVDPTEELGLDHLDQVFNGLRDAATLLDLDLQELAG